MVSILEARRGKRRKTSAGGARSRKVLRPTGGGSENTSKYLVRTLILLVLSVTVLAPVAVAATMTVVSDGTVTNAVLASVDSRWGNPVGNGAQWIWSSHQVSTEAAVTGDVCQFTKMFDMPCYCTIDDATLTITADNGYEVFLNYISVGNAQVSGDWDVTSPDLDSTICNRKESNVNTSGWQSAEVYYSISPTYFQQGWNTLSITAANEYMGPLCEDSQSIGTPESNPAGVIFKLEITYTPDTAPPVIDPQATDKTVECDGAGNTTALNDWLSNHGGAAASDICCGTDVTWSNDFEGLSDDCGETGSATVTFTATDCCGLTATTSATFTIEDTTPPEITCPADVTLECPADTTPAATGEATGSDNCGEVTITHSDSEEAGCGNTKTITRTWTATDECGLSATCEQVITVVDTTPPVLTVPAPATFECDGAGNTDDINGWLASVSAMDTCGLATITNDYTGLTGVCSGTGSATVMFTATDECDNAASATSTAAVVDTTPPVANDDSATTVEDTPVTVDVLANDSDTCSTDLTIVAVSAPVNGTATIADNAVLYTPAENYNGVDEFTYTIEDCSGNSATATVTITINPVTNAPPQAEDQFLTTCDNTPLPITLSASDPEVDPDPVGPQPHPLTFTIWGSAADGTVSGDLGAVTYSDPHTASVEVVYTPAKDFVGTDVFTFLVEDPFSEFAIGMIDITVEDCGVPVPAGGGGVVAPGVVINEVAWGGTQASPADEWIELVNNTDQSIDLTGWILRWRRKQAVTPEEHRCKEVELSGTIEADDYYLLERRHDKTVSDIEANLLYDTNKPYHLELSDLGEIMELVNPGGDVVDTANADHPERDGWVAGTGPTSFGTMERIDPLSPDLDENWATNRGMVVNGLDGDRVLLTATAKVINEQALIRSLEETVPQEIPAGKRLTITLPFPEALAGVEGVPRATLVAAGVAGGGGAVEPAIQEAALSGRRVAGLPNYELSLDTSQLAPGTYRLWISMGNKIFPTLTIKIVEE